MFCRFGKVGEGIELSDVSPEFGLRILKRRSCEPG